VCPTGIDIRNGMQYECINCGLCVDACDETMTRFNYKKGLKMTNINFVIQAIEQPSIRLKRETVFFRN